MILFNLLKNFLIFLGIFVLVYLYFHTKPLIYLLTRFGIQNLKKKYNAKWALITGGSHGIGLEIAKILAQQGINLFLLSSTQEKLDKACVDLKKVNPKIQVRVIQLDLTSSSENIEKVLEEVVGEQEIELMFSNAGAGIFGKFEEESFEAIEKFLRLNLQSHVKMTHWFLKRCSPQKEKEKGKGKEKEKQKRALVFTSSCLAYFALPFASSLYHSSKAFLTIFGGSLYSRVKDKGVDILTVHPGIVNTGFAKVDGKFVHDLPKGQEPDIVAKIIVNAVGKFSQIQTSHMGVLMVTMRNLFSTNTISQFGLKIYRKQQKKLLQKKDN
ncbi:oxidoreductase short chain dehydrogenase/reductase family protein [Anaeramoeba flamelloides]|uniref:Oxidoreductase short chain dehydrogenase/reductase family protein n=1 Tax=Anaeramoeba flamelloides TaxID=1746091 RepID=A0AAV7Z300_9EUKA|nr:oxidoreductase short chain dehydrogenase/reductase family protein [Anaeramoeba flamelloides]